MDKCQYYKGTDKIDADTTKILCSYMTSGGKTFKNKDPEGAALIQCCWHREKAEGECPLFDENLENSILDKPDAVSEKEDDNDDDEGEFKEGEKLQTLADEFRKMTVVCPYFGESGSVTVNPFGAMDFECECAELKFIEEIKAAEQLEMCCSAPEKCYYYRKAKEEEGQPVEQQTFTTEVAASNDTQVSSERQDRAAKLTQQIMANGKIAANSMIEMGRDLKAVRDERLFTEMGYENFEEYCEKKIGIGKRHGYNFIQIYEKFGEEKLGQLQQFGITKLLEIAKLDDEDADDLLQHNDINALSVRELSAKVDEYRNKYEQLTMQFEEEKSKNSENASLESQVEELKRFTATLNDNYNKALKEKAEAIKEHQSEMKKLTVDRDKQVEELKKQLEAAREENEDLQSGALNAEKYFEDQKDAMLKEKKALSEKIKELESRPAEKAEISEAERAALIQQGRDEMCKEKDESWGAAVELARKTATRNTEKKFTEEIDSLKILNSELRKIADSDKEKYRNELEKLKAENAALQSNAQNSPAPSPMSGARDKVKFYFKQIESAFTAATEAVSEADAEERIELTTALKKALERMSAALDQTE